jgi:competence protein ComEA
MNVNRTLAVIASLLLGSSLALADTVDINSASAEQISQGMVGIGKVKAASIVQDREKNGAFKSVDELTRVKGIKSATIDKNRDRITVGQASASGVADTPKK